MRIARHYREQPATGALLYRWTDLYSVSEGPVAREPLLRSNR